MVGWGQQALLWSVKLQRWARAALFTLQPIRKSGGPNHSSIAVLLQRRRKTKHKGEEQIWRSWQLKLVESIWLISVEDLAVTHQAARSSEPLSCLLVWWFKRVFFFFYRRSNALSPFREHQKVETKHACSYCYTRRLCGFVWIDEQSSRCWD